MLKFMLKNLQRVNIELAIGCYKAVLEVQSPKISAQKIADIQHSMGVVNEARMKGSKAENLETAIKYYEKALEGRTFETSPQDWAETKYQLGSVYYDRIWGERAKNLALAIHHLSEASKVRTFEASPEKWANTQNALANAYRYLTEGNKAENFKLSLSCYEEALKVRTPESSPKEWSRIKYNIGVLYLDYLGNLAESASPNIFASCMCSEGLAYVLIYPEIRQAIENLLASLEVRIPEKYPIERAESLNVLGTVYIQANYIWETLKKMRNYEILDEMPSARSLETSLQPLATEIAKNITIERGIEYLIESLNTINFQDHPLIWGENNINLAYAYLCLEDLPENRELAIASYKEALKGFTQQSFPHNHLEVQYEMGQLYQKNNQLDEAYSAFAAAIDTVELLRNEINYVRDESKDKLAEKWNGLYQDMVKLCLDLKKYSEAIEYVERSKSRNLVELLANSELYPKDASDSLKQDLRRLRSTISSIRQLLAQADNNSTFNRDSFQGFRSSETSSYNREYIAQQRELLQEYQRQLDEVFAQCQQRDPAFTLTQEVKPITIAEIRDLIDSHTAILEWYIGTDSFQIFIVTQSSLEVMQFDKTELEKLEAWNQQYLEALFNNTETWQDNLSEWLSSLSQILRLDEILNHPALANCDSLILVPHRYLHLFPLHALSVSQQTWLRFNQETSHLQPPANPCLLDCFKKGVRYVPSCQLLQRVQQRQRPPADTRTLFAIQNPTEDLAYTDIEVEVIKRDFTPADILSKQQATKTALIDNLETLAQAHYVHFSCHGSFDFQTPLISSLILAGAIESTDSPTPTGQKSLRLRSGGQANPAKCLTLQDIFATLNLPKCRLVTLSACETGLTDTTKQSDDCIGLATGFLYAGSQGVLSSLWSVDDFATAYLMIKCYENLATADIAVALNTAQIWLRDATQSKLLEWIGELKLNSESTQHIKGFLGSYDSDEKPFESPFYWAAFCAIGN
jgi:CHAT domain-containing protein